MHPVKQYMYRRQALRRAAKILVLLFVLLTQDALASPIKSDETVVFFPTAARLSADASHWRLPIHAWVFEAEADSWWRRGALAGFARGLGLAESATESRIFKQRARWFLVDNERGKQIGVSLSDGETLGPSGPNGHLVGELTLRRRTAGTEPASFWLDYAAVLPRGDDRVFRGESLFVTAEGLSVISDIDDTVKVSQVTDKAALLTNTFLKPFTAAPGMAEAYRHLATAGAVFHYVSSSPWQLYPALRDFMDAADLPRGSFHLRSFRLKDQSFLNLFKSSRETKPPVIEGLLTTYPKRDFILIGDSGEQDPEIYGAIARRYPGRIRHIYIRRVTPEVPDGARYRDAFAGLPAASWTLFEDAAAISP